MMTDSFICATLVCLQREAMISTVVCSVDTAIAIAIDFSVVVAVAEADAVLVPVAFAIAVVAVTVALLLLLLSQLRCNGITSNASAVAACLDMFLLLLFVFSLFPIFLVGVGGALLSVGWFYFILFFRYSPLHCRLSPLQELWRRALLLESQVLCEAVMSYVVFVVLFLVLLFTCFVHVLSSALLCNFIMCIAAVRVIVILMMLSISGCCYFLCLWLC